MSTTIEQDREFLTEQIAELRLDIADYEAEAARWGGIAFRQEFHGGVADDVAEELEAAQGALRDMRDDLDRLEAELEKLPADG